MVANPFARMQLWAPFDLIEDCLFVPEYAYVCQPCLHNKSIQAAGLS
jgi:hypothetical protein